MTHVLGANLGFPLIPSQLFTSPSPCQSPTDAALKPECSGQQEQDKGRDQTEGSFQHPPAPQLPELFADAGFSEPGASPRVALCRCQFIPEMRTQESSPHTPSHALPLVSSSKAPVPPSPRGGLGLAPSGSPLPRPGWARLPWPCHPLPLPLLLTPSICLSPLLP